MGIFLEELIQTGSFGGFDSVAADVVGQAKAVHDNQGGWRFVHKNLISRTCRVSSMKRGQALVYQEENQKQLRSRGQG